MGNINFNQPPVGNGGITTAWLVQAVQLLNKRVSAALQNSGGGGGGISLPVPQIAFGTGTGIGGSNGLIWFDDGNNSTGTFYAFSSSSSIQMNSLNTIIGKYTGGTGTFIDVNEDNIEIKIGDRFGLDVAVGIKSLVLGDFDGVGNRTNIDISDTDKTISFGYDTGKEIRYDLTTLTGNRLRNFSDRNGTEFLLEDYTGTYAPLKLSIDGSIAMTGALDMGTHLISNVTDPSSAQDAATKHYVDAFVTGLSWKQVARVATTIALVGTYNNGTAGVGATFTITATGVLTIDGVATVLGDRIIVQNQVAAAQNGIYSVTVAGAGGVSAVLTRTTDADTSSELVSAAIATGNEGSTLANLAFTQTTPATITIGTDPIAFQQLFNSAFTAGTGIRIASNVVISTLAEGKTGGQSVIGGTGSEDTLTVQGSENASARTTTAPAIILNSVGVLGGSTGAQVHTRQDVTVNASGTAGYTAWKLAVTETTTGSGTKNLVDLQVGAASKFAVSNTGKVSTNGGIKKRVGTSTANSATPAINTDLYDIFRITTQSANITSFTSSLTGTPDDGQIFMVQIKDNGSAITITWGASFESTTVTLPSTTVASTLLRVLFQWNTLTSKWSCIATC